MARSRINILRASQALLAMEKTFPMEISDGQNRPFWWGSINRIGFWFLFFTICSLFARHRGRVALQGLISPKLCTTASWKPLWDRRDRSGDTAHPILATLLMQQAETQVPYTCRVWGCDGKGGLDSHGRPVSRQQWAGLPGGGKILGAMKRDKKACQRLVQEVGMLLKGGKRAAEGGRASKGGQWRVEEGLPGRQCPQMLLPASRAASLIQTLAAITSALSVRSAASVNAAYSRGSKQRRRRLQERVNGLGEHRSVGRRCLLSCKPVLRLTAQGWWSNSKRLPSFCRKQS